MGIIKSKGHNPAYNVEKIFDRFLFFEDIPGKTDNDDDLFVDLTIDYLEANKNSKNFVFLHYMKSHSPYYLPSYFEETELDKDRNLDPGKEFYDAQIGYQDTKIAVNLKGDIFENKIRLRQEVRLRKIDMLLGNIFNYLEKNNLANSMVILTADHGIPHGEKNRSFLDNNWINIPLKIKYPSSSINLNSINTNPVSPVEFYDLLFKNMKHEQKNGKFFENDLKSNFVFSESIFNEVYKVVISSRFFQFRFACSFDPLRKVVFINKIIFSSYSENGKDIQIESNKYYYFLKKIKENLIKSLSVN